MEEQKKTQQINRPLEYGCVKVLRGKDQIGGSVVQITSASGTRIWVDFGSELSVPTSKSTDSELVKLMHDKETRPSAVFFTHIHGDHIGLLSEIEDDVDIYIGELGKKMKDNVINALTKPAWREETEEEKIQREKLQREQYLLNREEPKTCFYKNGESQKYNEEIEFAALRVDHSVFDSYMLKFKVKVMENDKETTKVILHTGDFRGHGRLGENLIENLKQFINNQQIDILITEGTMMSRAAEKVMTEVDMQKKAKEILEREENKYAFLICSSTNLDSLSSFYRAAVNSKNNRALYCSEYIKSQLELFTKEIGEKENRWEYKFYRSYEFDKQLKLELKNGQKQEQYMRENGFLLIVNQYDQKIMEHFSDLNPLMIYSMWDGYLDAKKPYANKNLINIVNKMGERVERLHTSGHATPALIEDVIKTVDPQEAIIPIHTEKSGSFFRLSIDNKYKRLLKVDMNKTYQEWADEVDKTLDSDMGWLEKYGDDAKKMIENRVKIAEARKLFKVRKPLSVYITIGHADAGKPIYDLRFLGQSVGTIRVDLKTKKVLLDAKDQKEKNSNKSYFGYNLGEFKGEDWNKSKKAKAFRKFYKDYAEGKPRQDEHRVEEALFSEFEKSSSKIKSICGITPIRYEGIRFHMMTSLRACESKDDEISVTKSYRGGDIDILCRRNKSIAVIEVKDKYTLSESYERAIKQAISYAVFIRKIVRSEIKDNWLKLWGMENLYKEKMKFLAVAAMPYEYDEQIPEFANETIKLGNDIIELHCIGISKDSVDGKKGNVECMWK